MISPPTFQIFVKQAEQIFDWPRIYPSTRLAIRPLSIQTIAWKTHKNKNAGGESSSMSCCWKK
jgi:hypothetical protein